jgi:hypothetical protein
MITIPIDHLQRPRGHFVVSLIQKPQQIAQTLPVMTVHVGQVPQCHDVTMLAPIIAQVKLGGVQLRIAKAPE